jgi:hypothetical protein
MKSESLNPNRIKCKSCRNERSRKDRGRRRVGSGKIKFAASVRLKSATSADCPGAVTYRRREEWEVLQSTAGASKERLEGYGVDVTDETAVSALIGSFLGKARLGSR